MVSRISARVTSRKPDLATVPLSLAEPLSREPPVLTVFCVNLAEDLTREVSPLPFFLLFFEPDFLESDFFEPEFFGFCVLWADACISAFFPVTSDTYLKLDGASVDVARSEFAVSEKILFVILSAVEASEECISVMPFE